MPEGPEILYTNIYLKKLLKNTQIETIKSFTDKPAIIPKDYIGEVEDIGCKGKLFWIKVSGKEKSYYIDIHYGITGWLEEEKPEKNIKFELEKEKLNNLINKKKILIIENDCENDCVNDIDNNNDNVCNNDKESNINNEDELDKDINIEGNYVNKENIKKIIKNFKKKGITILETLNEKQLSNILNEANKNYYNNTLDNLLLLDNEYDIIKEFISYKYPNNNIIQKIGATVGSRKVKLPYFMGSMDKIKPDTEALNLWKKKYNGPYVLSCKLDGVSGLYSTENDVPKLYTRGDGKIGQDISNFIPYLNLPKKKDLVIRGEFIISKSIFENKYKTIFANPRNMVAGIINNKTPNEIYLKDIHFIAYELIKPELTPVKQLEFLSSLNINVVYNQFYSDINNEILSELLKNLRYNHLYEIDGLIVTNNNIYKREIGNPEHSFAFKMILSDQVAEAKVVDVIWSPSKDGYLKPRVQIEPIQLGGVKIEFATGFNAAFIYSNKIGIGAIVEIIRSGDVIPHIQNVVVKASEAKMPDETYIWNDSKIDVILINKELDETVKEKNITGFFKGIGVEGLSSGNISRIIKAGFDSIPKILQMKILDFLKVEGFKEKTATKLYNGIQECLINANIVQIMAATNIFGRGFSDKKIEIIMEAFPTLLISNESNEQKINHLSSIKGMSFKTSEAFVEKIKDFLKFITDTNFNFEGKLIYEKNTNLNFDESHPLFGKTIVMTGFRDGIIQDEIKKIGAKLGNTVSKNTFILLVKDLMEDSIKAEEARKLKIPIITPEQFKKKYLS